MPPPLEPFLAVLRSDGVHVGLADYRRLQIALQARSDWSLPRLRRLLVMLVAKSPEEEDLVVRRFDELFLDNTDLPAVAPERLQRAVEGLESTKWPEPPKPEQTEVMRPESSGWWPVVATALLAAMGLWFLLVTVELEPALERIGSYISPGMAGLEARPPARGDSARAEPGAGTPATPAPRPPGGSGRTARTPANTAGDAPISLLPMLAPVAVLSLLGLIYLANYPHLRPALRANWRGEGGAFDPGRVAAPGPPYLSAQTIDRIADGLSRRPHHVRGRELNLAATVERSARQAGLPLPVYRRRRRTAPVTLLVDTQTPVFDWNPTPVELAEGLRRRGLDVALGRKRGASPWIRFDDGRQERWRLDLHGDSNRQLLVFSDGTWLGTVPEAIAALHSHGKDPVLLVPDEPPAVTAAARALARRRFPGVLVSTCSEAGLDAVAHALSRATPGQATTTPRPPPSPGHDGSLAGRIDALLMEAAPWAQACAMVQPIAFSLAQELRRRLFPDLSAGHMARLLALPDTQRTSSTLHFAPAVAALLRASFAARHEAEEQERIVRLILSLIKGSEPADPRAIEHATWDVYYQRVRLEIEPDAAAIRLAELGRTALRPLVLGRLAHLTVEAEQEWIEPLTQTRLLREPSTEDGRQALAEVAQDAGIPIVRPYPLTPAQWAALTGLTLLGFVGMVLELTS